ncbi:MAG: hypothetical protein ABEJ72_08675, partial [Candidatus Aenigmatarchaeota archaeon]
MEIYEETERGSLEFRDDKTAKEAIDAYRQKYSLYSPDLGPHVDRLYRSQLAAPFGTQLAERVGEILVPESEEVREEIKSVVEEEL